MRGPEARKLLTAAGFTISKSTATIDVYEFDDEIRVPVSKRDKSDDVRTHREVESALRRAAERKKQHESRQAPPPIMCRAETPAERALTAKLGVMVQKLSAPPRPPPAPVAPPPPAAPPPPSAAPVEDEDEVEQKRSGGGNRKMPMAERLPLWRRIVVLHELENLSFGAIAERLEKEGVKKPSGQAWTASAVSLGYRTFHEYRELMKLPGAVRGPAPAPAVPLIPGLPDYFRGMLADPALAVEKKVAVLRALAPKLPASVALMMEDAELTDDQKLGILAIVLRKEGA
jgi:hypothetical protein